jgi:hypothetical protein
MVRKELAVRLSLSTAIAAGTYALGVAAANTVIGALYKSYPDLAMLGKAVSGVVACLSFLLAHSFLSVPTRRSESLHFIDTAVKWVVLGVILALSLFMASRAVPQILAKSVAHWEQIPTTSLQHVDTDFVKQFQAGALEECGNCDLVRADRATIDGDRKRVLFMHPASEVTFRAIAPVRSELLFSIALMPAVWQIGKGDGVQFSLDVGDGRVVQRVFAEYIDPKNRTKDRRWYDYEVDLSKWAGETVTITFSTSCGPNDDCRYDWAGWGAPRIVQPVAYDFLTRLPQANTTADESGQVHTGAQTIDGETRSILSQHATSRARYTVTLPQQPTLRFGFGVAPEAWSQPGDGVEANLYVRDPDEPSLLYRVYNRYCDPKNNPDDRHWFDEEVDLSRWGGKTVEVIFEVLPGPAGDEDYDWAGWSEPVLIDDTPP